MYLKGVKDEGRRTQSDQVCTHYWMFGGMLWKKGIVRAMFDSETIDFCDYI